MLRDTRWSESAIRLHAEGDQQGTGFMLIGGTLGAIVAVLAAFALAWKWELGMRRSALVVAIAAAALVIVVALDSVRPLSAAVTGVMVWALTMAGAATILLWRFYRDPERVIPAGEGVVVSPADGIVAYVQRCDGGQLPVSDKRGRRFALHELTRTSLQDDDAIVIGVALSFLDVHVNRAPVAGTLALQERHPGGFASLKNREALFTNERATFVLERPGLQVAVVLIASRLVRRIVSYVRQGDYVAAGHRIGAIRFGSQVDLVLPDRPDVRVLVDPGHRVRAGETVVARVGSLVAAPREAQEAPAAEV